MKHQLFPHIPTLANLLKGHHFGYDIKSFGANAVTVTLGGRQNYIGRELLETLAKSTTLASILPKALMEIIGQVELVEDLSETAFKDNSLEVTGVEGRVELELRDDSKIVVRNGFSQSPSFLRVLVFDPRMIHDLMLWVDPKWSDERVLATNEVKATANLPAVIQLGCDTGGRQEDDRLPPLVLVAALQVDEGPTKADTLPFPGPDETEEIPNIFAGAWGDQQDDERDGCMAEIAAAWRSRRGRMAAE